MFYTYVFHSMNSVISAGVGRTGTFIVLDYMLQELAAGAQDLSVYETVMYMRRHRVLIVQSLEQYVYIHECLVDAIQEELEKRARAVTNTGEEYTFNMFFISDSAEYKKGSKKIFINTSCKFNIASSQLFAFQNAFLMLMIGFPLQIHECTHVYT